LVKVSSNFLRITESGEAGKYSSLAASKTVETPEGDVIAIRYKLMLSHSFDHRVVNGALGGMFVQRVAQYLEQWDINREI